MNEKMYTAIARTMQAIMLFMVLMIVLNLKSCADSITINDYDGFTHECEKAGGIVNDDKCFAPNVLLDMENNVTLDPLINAEQ